MIIPLITVILIIVIGLLIKNANIKKSKEAYVLVLLGGIVILFFEPASIVLFTDGSKDGGAIQIASTIIGIYCIVWSIAKIIKIKKV